MKSERLSNLTQIAEIVGSVGVVVSLLYVGYEISQNTREVQASNRQAIAGRVQEFTLTVASTPKLALALSGEVDPDTLPTDQRTQLAYYLIAFFGNSEDAFHQYADGLLTEEYWEARAAIRIFQAKARRAISTGPATSSSSRRAS